MSVPSQQVAGIEAATGTPTSVSSHDVAALEVETSTPTYTAPTEVPTEVPSTDYGEAFYATAVAIAQTLDISTPVPGIPPEKQGLSEERMQRAVATALILFPVPTGYVPPRATEPPWPPPPPPIVNNRPAGNGFMIDYFNGDSLSANTISRVNGWYEEKDNTKIVALAGRSYKEVSPRQGQVYIATYDLRTGELIVEPVVYSSPTRHGELRITDVVGERLTLTAEDNTQFYFDVATRTWSSP